MNKYPDLVQRGGKWWVIRGSSQYGPFDTKQAAIEFAAQFIETA